MSLLFLLLLISIIYLVACVVLKKSIYEIFQSNISIVILVGMFISIIATFVSEGHPTDIGCFNAWSRMLYSDGFSKFYTSPAFTDYPPGYMYVLYAIGAIRALFESFSISYNYVLLLKLPAIMANIITGVFIYAVARKKTTETKSIALSLFYILNPLVLFNASVWGQVDSIHTLTIIMAIYFIIEKKLLQSSLVFVLCVLIKPQSFMFSPLYIFVFFMNLKEETIGMYNYIIDQKKRFFKISEFLVAGKPFFKLLLTYIRYFLLCACFAFFLILPFADTKGAGFNLMPIIQQYIDTLSSYNYASVNAYNLYALLGLNWYSADNTFLGIALTTWGNIILVLIVIFSLYMLSRSRIKSNYFFIAAIINMLTFAFSIKMHERYAFPVIALLLMAYIYKMDKRILYTFFAASFVVFANCVDVLRITLTAEDWVFSNVTMPIFSFMTLAVAALMVVLAFKVYPKHKFGLDEDDILSSQFGDSSNANTWIPLVEIEKKGSDSSDNNQISAETIEQPEKTESLDETQQPEPIPPAFEIQKSEEPARMRKKDYLSMLVVTIVYAVVAFANLGNTSGPQSIWVSSETKEVIVDLGQVNHIKKAHWFLGVQPDKVFTISTSDDGENWSQKADVTTKSVFSWSNVDIGSTARYIKLETEADDLSFVEMGFEDNKGKLISVASSNSAELFDEQEFIPINFPDKTETNEYMSGTYFDEIYHARTAYEYINKLPVYENTHPPLGKVIISFGISIFGMTPFGWRFAGTLFGVLMLPLIFIFAKRMFKGTFWAFFATTIFAFDFMHYAQTRLATIDTYITFFVIAMFYYMYKYWRMSFYDTPFRKTLWPLFMSGLCMGLGIACKWPGVYAAAGLAVIFFIVIFRRFYEYMNAPKHDIEADVSKFPKYIGITLLCCLVFFIIIPAIIYCVSYIPYYLTDSLYPNREAIPFLTNNPGLNMLFPDNIVGNFLASIVQAQINMFDYHSMLVSTHPYSSPWWSWTIIIKPIYYYSNYYSETIRAGISSFGNPAVWIGGLVALGYTVKDLFNNLASGAKLFAVIVIGFAAQFIIGNVAILITVLAIVAYCVVQLYQRKKYIPSFLIIGYFAQLVFWIPVTRTTYIYHYFPCVPFLVLLLTYMFKDLSVKYRIKPAVIYLCAVVALFIMYYPVLTGTGVYLPYVQRILKLFTPYWQLVS